MTIFARYYQNGRLFEYSMTDIENLLMHEKNKELIANTIYHRYYDRFLKLFYYASDKECTYIKSIGGKDELEIGNEFNTEYKSGFAIMTNCCLLIEVLATFFEGTDETSQGGTATFDAVFRKAAQYNNELKIFENTRFYKNIRCGLLHQGEVYGKFKIRRRGKLFDDAQLAINAKLFCDRLNDFLRSYEIELTQTDWNAKLWDSCRVKLRFIINNSR